jgi:hypothetical protein
MHCAACGYNLTAHAGGDRCPECGLEVDATLWVEAEREEEATPERFGTLIIGGFWMFAAGAVVTSVLFGMWQSSSTGPLTIFVAGAASAAITGAVSAMVRKRYVRIWASIYAWPAMGWGTLSIILYATGGSSPAFWPVLGIIMLGAAISGADVGRWLLRVRVPTHTGA